MSFLDALKAVIHPDRIASPVGALTETRAGSRCEAIPVQHRRPHFALRLKDNDHLQLLRGSRGRADGYTNLPDYLVFSEGPETKKAKIPELRVLVCELKSSEASHELARRQVQLGALVVPYVVALARLDSGLPMPTVCLCGLIAYQERRPRLARVLPGRVGEPEEDVPDGKVGIYIYPVRCGEPIDLDSFFYCPARI